MKARLIYFLELFLDLLFPKQEIVRELETMAPEKLLTLCSYGTIDPWLHDKGIRPLLTYRHRHVRLAIWELKYKGNTKIARLLAGVLAEVVLKNIPEKEKVVVTSVPLSSKRLKERGFDQLGLVLNEISSLSSPISVRCDILKKIRHTVPQTTLPRKRRLENVKGCFEVVFPENIFGSYVVLIDDVVTTGTTLEEARKVLLKSGAKAVHCIAIAH